MESSTSWLPLVLLTDDPSIYQLAVDVVQQSIIRPWNASSRAEWSVDNIWILPLISLTDLETGMATGSFSFAVVFDSTALGVDGIGQ